MEYLFSEGKWDDGKAVYDDKLSLSIAATCLHYGQECFEGLKVFESSDGRALVFRVEENAKRMFNSAKKIMMEPIPEDKFIEAVYKVVQLNKQYIPPHGCGASFYLRPLLIGVSPIIGVRPSEEFLFVVFGTPAGPYFKSGLKPIKLRVEESMDRAAPNGVGDSKVGGNYAAGLRASIKAKSLGFQEALYLDAKEKKYIDESGPANFFGITNDDKYITPNSNSILPSITNKSLRVLAEEMGLKVEVRPVHIDEIFNLKEAGCCGTAAVITPVKSITYGEKVATYTEGDEIGPVSKQLYDRLKAIQQGLAEDKHGWVREIPLD
jgi:branched-chain amino acid aminotransferase